MERFDKKHYLEQQGGHCPYCGKKNIVTVGEVEPGTGQAWQELECHDCGRMWKDIYDLVDVEEE